MFSISPLRQQLPWTIFNWLNVISGRDYVIFIVLLLVFIGAAGAVPVLDSPEGDPARLDAVLDRLDMAEYRVSIKCVELLNFFGPSIWGLS